jgi:phosphocarrier protein HPr
VIERTLRLKNRLGLHARAAAKVVHTAAGFDSKVTLARDGDEVDGKSILGLLLLAASQGSELVVRVEGTDEKDAFEALQSLIDRKFDEKE